MGDGREDGRRGPQAFSRRFTIQAMSTREPARAISKAMVIGIEGGEEAPIMADGPGGSIAVFVYGTLRRGGSNHAWLAGSHYGGEGRLPGARLYDLGPFPMAIVTPETAAESIEGELWWVDAAVLTRLDRLEGHPRLYERRQLPLACGRWAWVYLGRPRQVRHSPVLPQGRWPRAGGAQLALALALTGGIGIAPVGATVAGCATWRASHGVERIRLSNRLGAAHYLTKDKRLQTSPEDAPINLYRASDLRRLCDER
jgi:gamma-glutamylcyclotransferase (GGCT)/AIG2-like uncharacterized protein YtfP